MDFLLVFVFREGMVGVGVGFRRLCSTSMGTSCETLLRELQVLVCLFYLSISFVFVLKVMSFLFCLGFVVYAFVLYYGYFGFLLCCVLSLVSKISDNFF